MSEIQRFSDEDTRLNPDDLRYYVLHADHARIVSELEQQLKTARELLRRARGFVGVVHGDSAESLAERTDAHLNP
jgi:hypothetical protein